MADAMKLSDKRMRLKKQQQQTSRYSPLVIVNSLALWATRSYVAWTNFARRATISFTNAFCLGLWSGCLIGPKSAFPLTCSVNCCVRRPIAGDSWRDLKYVYFEYLLFSIPKTIFIVSSKLREKLETENFNKQLTSWIFFKQQQKISIITKRRTKENKCTRLVAHCNHHQLPFAVRLLVQSALSRPLVAAFHGCKNH